ncbi:MIP/aquaporin family protein [Bacillus sp. ISL-46]|uniref:MIP/aquaporin family protein n=1 Tax=Bacillus sp. ISL-46 TaxID=2819129 RepID=UPI001BE80579|nr:MIP/aquaporin family protein [Bacillus sp. ISL-46]MBT2722138.1 aquaporin family protein [Bacillus sp. ISL-46]
MTAFWGEVIGTAILIFLGGCVCAGTSLKKSYAHNAGWMVVTFAWGLAVSIAIYAVGKFSGAHFNPVVTLVFALNGDFPWNQVPFYLAAQLLGAVIGAIVVYLQYLPHWKETDDSDIKLGVFVTRPAIPDTFSNLLSEMIGTFVLIVGLLSIGANKFTDGLNPLIIGFLIISLGMSLGGTTGAALNPARDLGPRIAHFLLPIPGKGRSNWGYAWIPVVGPSLGGSLGGLFYKAVFLGKPTPQFWILLASTAIVLIVAYTATAKKKPQAHIGSKKKTA